MRTAARLLSVLLHPVFMPSLTLWAMITVDPGLAYFVPPDRRPVAIAMVALMSALFPLVSMQLLVRAGVITNLELHERRERPLAYGITLIYFGATWYLMHRTPFHPAVQAMLIGAFLALLLTLLITVWWKISAHLVGMGGLIGAVGAVNSLHQLGLLPVLGGLIALAGLVASARLICSDHTLAQVLAGGALGFVSTWTCIVVLGGT
jgi:hypothetical protein